MEKPFDNKNRNRYYGLRIGDTVDATGPNGIVWGRTKVIGYGETNNNEVYIENALGARISWVAEWCTLIRKVEDNN